MLLGAARYLAETRNFSGTVVLVFQPAEEGGAGAKAMIDDGLVKRFGIEQFFGMHNLPGLAAGEFAMRVGPIMAATDNFDIEIEGAGGHAARPHLTVDPIVIGAQLVNALQAVVSRNVDPLEAAVVSVCHFEAGHTHNVIAPRALLQGTSRSLTESVRAVLESRIRDIVDGVARQHGATIKLDYQRGYPVTVNHADETHLAERIAADVAGATRVHATPPLMAGEDFSYMLREKPGAFIFVGNGDSSGLHTPGYDFNDEVLPVGMSYWIRLVETALPA
jgi:hippurate hydrolase